MRILMVGAGDPPSSFISRQIDILRKSQVDVVLFPDFTDHRYTNHLLCKKGFTFHVPAAMQRFVAQADLVHFQWPGHFLTYRALAKRFSKPTILSLRGRQINVAPHLPGNEKIRKALQRKLPLCTAYHCVSQDMLRRARSLGVDPARTWVITTGIDTSFFQPPARLPEMPPLRIAMVGALTGMKGYEYALLALRQLLDRGRDAVLTVVGEGAERDRMAYTMQDLGLAAHVSLAGKQSIEEVRNILAQSHVLLHTSLSEGMPNVVVEAMACGLPVVATDVGGVREAVTHGSEGFVVALFDIRAITDALEMLIEKPEARIAIGGRARARAIRDFKLENQGRKFIDMYEAVLAQWS